MLWLKPLAEDLAKRLRQAPKEESTPGYRSQA